MIKVLSKLTGKNQVELHRVSTPEIINLFNHFLIILGEFKNHQKPKKVITIKNQEFELVNPHKVASGWHIDNNTIDSEKNPHLFAALLYIPKGKPYGERDVNHNIIAPLKQRAELFKKELPLVYFLSASAFFLNKYKLSLK